MELSAKEDLGSYDYLLKTIVLGESGTGKSCLTHAFVHGKPKTRTTHTIGVDCMSRLIEVGSTNIKLQIWDTAGQERFRSVTRGYYRGTAIVLLVYDITKRDTFTSLTTWFDDVHALTSRHTVVVLVGTKLDREMDEREVDFLEASHWAAQHGALFTEVSSFTGENVQVPFELAARSLLLGIEAGRINPDEADTGIFYGGPSTSRGRSHFSLADTSLASDDWRSSDLTATPKTRRGCCT